MTSMIYIGTYAATDVDEADSLSENAASLLGTYSSSGMQIVDFTFTDLGTTPPNQPDGAIYDDEYGTGELLHYDLGAGPVSVALDSSMTFNALVTEVDGTQHSVIVVVIQAANGDTFVTDHLNEGSLDNLAIGSIQLASIDNADSAGIYTDQSTTGTTVCFASGTLIETPDGPCPVQKIRPGDRVTLHGGGAAEVIWCGAWHLNRAGRSAPVEIAPGALGDGLPRRRLALSPQHRVLIRSRVAARMFDSAEVLVAARHLVGLPGIALGAAGRPITYWHIACAAHEVILAEGAPCETLLPGPEALKSLPPEARDRLALAGAELGLPSLGTAARPIPKGRRIRRMLERHGSNGRPLVDLAPGHAGPG